MEIDLAMPNMPNSSRIGPPPRESNRRSLANWRYLFRLFLPVGIVVLVIAVLAASVSFRNRDAIAWLSLGTMGVSVLGLLVLGTGVVATERIQQTLDVLLSTPMTAREILDQKVRPLRRIHWACAVIVILVLVSRLLSLPFDRPFGRELACTMAYLLMTALVLPAALWIGIWAGMVARSRARAVCLALAMCAAWMVVTPLATFAVQALVRSGDFAPCRRDASPA